MTCKIIPQDFYVYAHKKATTGEVFYIGKGYKNRIYDKKSRNIDWHNIVNTHGIVFEVLIDGLQEWAALEMERDLISLYGRRDLGQGVLTNKTDGGDGETGHVKSLDELATTGRCTEKPVQCSNGMLFKNGILAAKWLKNNGFPSASSTNISKVCYGVYEKAYGLRWKFSEKFKKIPYQQELRIEKGRGLVKRKDDKRCKRCSIDGIGGFNTINDALAYIRHQTKLPCCMDAARRRIRAGKTFHGFMIRIEPKA